MKFLMEMFRFLKVKRKLWLIPVLITMIILGALLYFAQNSVVGPFIYTVF